MYAGHVSPAAILEVTGYLDAYRWLSEDFSPKQVCKHEVPELQTTHPLGLS